MIPKFHVDQRFLRYCISMNNQKKWIERKLNNTKDASTQKIPFSNKYGNELKELNSLFATLIVIIKKEEATRKVHISQKSF